MHVSMQELVVRNWFHLHLAIETINRQQREINNLQVTKADKEDQIVNIIAGHGDPCVFNMTKFNPDTNPPNKYGTILHSTPTLEVTRCISWFMPMGVVMPQTLMCQCLPA